MDIWSWIYERRYLAHAQQDIMRLRMIDLFWSMMENLRNNPDLALQYGEQSRKIAQMVGDAWWIQLCHHWELQIKFNFKADFTDTLDLASKSAMEVRKGEYQAFPQRICLHEDLITAYVRQDPLSHQDLIQNALDYMEQETKPEVDCYRCLHNLKIEFAMACHRYQEAIPLAQQALIVSEKSDFHLAHVYGMLASISFRLDDWNNVQLAASSQEEYARKQRLEDCLIISLMWQAAYAEHAGDSKQAKDLQQQTGIRASRYGAWLGIDYYTALTAYHEQGNRLQDALKIQEILRDQMQGKSSYYDEAQVNFEIIRLKKILKQAIEDDIQSAKKVIAYIKNPAPLIAQLEKIVSS